MYHVHVTHYLNPQGLALFNNWFEKVKSLVSQQPGFVSINAYSDKEDSEAVHIDLEFENKAQLMAWAESEHHDIFRQLDPFRTRALTSLHTDSATGAKTLYTALLDGRVTIENL